MFEFFMIVAITGVMVCGIAFAVSRSQVKELETKLESQRQKREIDEAKRIELKQQLENAIKEVELQKAAIKRLDRQVHDPREALALLTRIIECNEEEHPR